ncbi:hypothetical protein [Neptuniibacter halophilus]|uniref:hypothetical protein n=1 Tax=Neptuniibacter halophilus TaxID=651666 RepID=UPI002573D75E|nr:hypothetical protein [Neptuniibacter halophilus]
MAVFSERGYQFAVEKVRYRQHGAFHSVTLYFNHPVVERLKIVSTQHPREIYVYQLQQQTAGEGFWETLESALNSVQHIGGQMFTIKPTAKHYYD